MLQLFPILQAEWISGNLHTELNADTVLELRRENLDLKTRFLLIPFTMKNQLFNLQFNLSLWPLTIQHHFPFFHRLQDAIGSKNILKRDLQFERDRCKSLEVQVRAVHMYLGCYQIFSGLYASGKYKFQISGPCFPALDETYSVLGWIAYNRLSGYYPSFFFSLFLGFDFPIKSNLNT